MLISRILEFSEQWKQGVALEKSSKGKSSLVFTGRFGHRRMELFHSLGGVVLKRIFALPAADFDFLAFVGEDDRLAHPSQLVARDEAGLQRIWFRSSVGGLESKWRGNHHRDDRKELSGFQEKRSTIRWSN